MNPKNAKRLTLAGLLAFSSLATAATLPTALDDLDLTPQARTFIEGLRESAANAATVDAQRRALPTGAVLGHSPAVHEVRDLRFEASGRVIPARLYRPSADPDRPVLVWMHSGSWVKGDLDLEDAALRTIANVSGWAVVAVGYRLAPEHPYPAALDDIEATIDALRTRQSEWGIDAAQLALGGNSAGANLAAAAIVRDASRSRRITGLILVQPLLDLRLNADGWRALGPRGLVLGLDETRANVARYVGRTGRTDDPILSPLLSPSLHDFPPTLILAAGVDPARGDAERFAARLAEARIAHELRVVRSVPHGFFLLAGLMPEGETARVEIGRWLREQSSPSSTH